MRVFFLVAFVYPYVFLFLCLLVAFCIGGLYKTINHIHLDGCCSRELLVASL